jgi:cytochrome c553
MRILLVLLTLMLASQAVAVDRGRVLYRKYCGNCHEPEKAGHTPDINAIRKLPVEMVLLAMESGTMKSSSEMMTDAERRAVAEFVSQQKLPGPLRTLRLDYVHSGNAAEERFRVDGVYRGGVWPGPPEKTEDTLGFGKYRVVVNDAASGRLVYSRGFASIYGEWETTAEAKEKTRELHESVRFPLPEARVKVTIEKRNARNEFQPVWTEDVDPNSAQEPATPAAAEVWRVLDNGDPADKVDLLLLGDGYTATEMTKWHKDAKRVSDALFAVSPFRDHRDDFNVWAIDTPSAESGVARPSDGIERTSAIGAAYDAFGSERYMLVFDNKRLRDIAGLAPYEFVIVLANDRKYGGGGIYNLYATGAVDNGFMEYLVVHEFGHHFAGLADEYYTSDVAYEIDASAPEPWEANVTKNPKSPKWNDLLTAGVPLPTPWPKKEFEKRQQKIQAERRALRAQNVPEEQMETLFRNEMAWTTERLGSSKHAGNVGAFEGANYSAKGTYRSQIDCMMFTRDEVGFCAACRRAIERVIAVYTR